MVDLLVFPSESDSFGLHKLEMKSNNKSTVVLIVGYFKFFLPLTYSKNNVISSWKKFDCHVKTLFWETAFFHKKISQTLQFLVL